MVRLAEKLHEATAVRDLKQEVAGYRSEGAGAYVSGMAGDRRNINLSESPAIAADQVPLRLKLWDATKLYREQQQPYRRRPRLEGQHEPSTIQENLCDRRFDC
jgi:hypothetical protein